MPRVPIIHGDGCLIQSNKKSQWQAARASAQLPHCWRAIVGYDACTGRSCHHQCVSWEMDMLARSSKPGSKQLGQRRVSGLNSRPNGANIATCFWAWPIRQQQPPATYRMRL